MISKFTALVSQIRTIFRNFKRVSKIEYDISLVKKAILSYLTDH